MGKFKEKWNKNRFSIYESEEKTVLKLIQNIWNFLTSFADELDNKTDLYGDHKGSWQGIKKPTLSDEGLRGTVEKQIEDIELINNTLNNTLNNLEKELKVILADNYGFIGDGEHDNINIFNNFKNEYSNNAILRFTEGKTYFFSGVRPKLNGVYIDGNNAILKLDINPSINEMKLISPVYFLSSSQGEKYRKCENVGYSSPLYNIGIANKKREKEVYINDTFTNWVNEIFNTTTGENTGTGTANITPTTIKWNTAYVGNPQLIRPPLVENKTCYDLTIASNGSNKYGFYIKTNDGYTIVANCEVGKVVWTISVFNSSMTLTTRSTKTLGNGGAFGVVLGTLQNLSFYYENDENVTFLIADKPVLEYRGNYGKIEKVAFYLAQGNNTNTFYFGQPMKIQNYKVEKHRDMNILLCGDSIFNGAWNTLKTEEICKNVLTNSYGVGDVSVTNKSVNSRTSGQLVEDIKEYNVTNYDYVVIMIGTNDQQGNVEPEVYSNNIKTLAEYCKGAGTTPIFVIPPIFTDKSITGEGLTTSNYFAHAKYSQALKLLCAENYYILCNARRKIQDSVNLYNDNIHLNEYGLISVFSEIAEVIGQQ